MIRDGIRRAFNLALRRKDQWEREVEEEIKLHLTLRAEQLMAHGATPTDAYHQAVRKFGALDDSRARLLEAARHRERQMKRIELFDEIRQDTLFALRTLSRQKGWTAITILTFALGIGATTAVFSVVSSLLLHGVPYPAPDRIVIVQQQPKNGNNTGIRVSIMPSTAIVNAWRAGTRAFESLEPYIGAQRQLRTSGDPIGVSTASVLPSFLTFAGERALVGRMFSAAEIENKVPVALLAEGIWRERYGADPSVIGRPIVVGDSTYTVIGVLPASLRLPPVGRDRIDVWLPLDLRNQDLGFGVLGRIRPGATIATATRDLDGLTAQVDKSLSSKTTFATVLRRPAELIDFQDALLMLTGAVALVLLVACANVAHLLMARAATRRRELAVRAALGADKMRVFRQLATESLVLAVVGAVTGVLLGWLGLRSIIALRPGAMSQLSAAHLDLTTLGVTVAVAVTSGLIFGVLGAFQTSRNSTHDSLKAGSLSTSSSRGHDRLRSVLVISEMALSATLIVGATLLVRTVVNMQRTDLGFEPKGLYAIRLSFPESRYKEAASRAAFATELKARLRTTRGVKELAFAGTPPGSRNFSVGTFEIDGAQAAAKEGGSSFTDVNVIERDFFKLMGIRLVEGTMFTDTSEAANQVIVNAGFARAHWPAGGAIGRRVRIAYQGHGTWMTIVGVASDALTAGPGAVSTAPLLYSSPSEVHQRVALMVRTNGSMDLATTVRQLVKSIDPEMVPPKIESTEEIVSKAIAGPRFTMLLLTTFTLLALLLAAVGLYGVMAYSVAQRTREIGIRVALGATQAAIGKSVVMRGVLLAFVGAALGLGGAYWGTRLIAQMLYGVAPLDVASFATGAIVLVLTAVVACVVPMRRALAVDPIRAIRAD